MSGTPGISPDDPGSGLQGDFRIGYYEYGLLQAAFMIGLLLGCPVFSALAKTANPFKLIGTGLGCWTIATMGCGLSPGYAALFGCRMAVGVGEASFCALAAPFIDDFAPPARKALWLAVFYLCIPLGVAGGFIYGGVIGGSQALGWRWAFIIESLAMAPIVVFCLVSAPIPMRGVTTAAMTTTTTTTTTVNGDEGECVDEEEGRLLPPETSSSSDDAVPSSATAADTPSSVGHATTSNMSATTTTTTAPTPASTPTTTTTTATKGSGVVAEFIADFRVLLRHPVYVFTLLGYVAYTAVIGVYAVWGPKAGFAIYGDVLGSPGNADMVLGLITVIAGAGGTIVGGIAVDREGASIGNAVSVCASSAAIGFVLLEASFVARNFAAFATLFLFGEIFAFVVQAPINAVILWSVPPGVRPLACSMTTVFIHALGDVPTPPLFGAILQRLGEGGGGEGGGGDSSKGGAGHDGTHGTPTPDDWRWTLCGFTLLMAASAAILAGVVPLSRRARDYRVVGGGVAAVGGGNGRGGGEETAGRGGGIGGGATVSTPLLLDEAVATGER